MVGPFSGLLIIIRLIMYIISIDINLFVYNMMDSWFLIFSF